MWRGRVLEYALRQHPEYLQVREDKMPALESRQSFRQPYDVSVAAWLGLMDGRTARCERSLSLNWFMINHSCGCMDGLRCCRRWSSCRSSPSCLSACTTTRTSGGCATGERPQGMTR